MNTILYIMFGTAALIGGWFVFYKLGYKYGSYKMDKYYSVDLARPLSLKRVEEILEDAHNYLNDTEPFMILNPDKWKYFD